MRRWIQLDAMMAMTESSESRKKKREKNRYFRWYVSIWLNDSHSSGGYNLFIIIRWCEKRWDWKWRKPWIAQEHENQTIKAALESKMTGFGRQTASQKFMKWNMLEVFSCFVKDNGVGATSVFHRSVSDCISSLISFYVVICVVKWCDDGILRLPFDNINNAHRLY